MKSVLIKFRIALYYVNLGFGGKIRHVKIQQQQIGQRLRKDSVVFFKKKERNQVLNNLTLRNCTVGKRYACFCITLQQNALTPLILLWLYLSPEYVFTLRLTQSSFDAKATQVFFTIVQLICKTGNLNNLL